MASVAVVRVVVARSTGQSTRAEQEQIDILPIRLIKLRHDSHFRAQAEAMPISRGQSSWPVADTILSRAGGAPSGVERRRASSCRTACR